MIRVFDTHTHYDDSAFEPDRDALLASLPEKGICGVLNCGASLEGCEASARLAEKYGFVYAAVGIHPENVSEFTPEAFERVKALARLPKCVAIGEIGLDYHWEGYDKAAQKQAFLAQLELAEELKKAVVIHNRDSLADIMDIVRAKPPKGVFHCFCESVETARFLLDRGLYLGFGGVTTFKNARKAVESVRYAPMDRILLETDCPYMAPEPCRGSRNDSSLLHFVAQRIAEIKGLDPDEVADTAADNARKLFGL